MEDLDLVMSRLQGANSHVKERKVLPVQKPMLTFLGTLCVVKV